MQTCLKRLSLFLSVMDCTDKNARFFKKMPENIMNVNGS